MNRFRAALWAIVFAGIAAIPDAAQACPNCRESLTASNSLAVGYATSIVMLLVVPCALLAAWIPLLVQLNRARAAESLRDSHFMESD